MTALADRKMKPPDPADASGSVDIVFDDDIDDWHPDPEMLCRWAVSARQDAVGHVSVRIVSETGMRELNRRYAGKDRPTNVLSFPAREMAATSVPGPDCADWPVASLDDWPLLGDIAVCASVVNREARQQHKTREAHWAHMMVHGVLHLRGFDHLQDQDARRMEDTERAILSRLGIADPYQEIEDNRP